MNPAGRPSLAQHIFSLLSMARPQLQVYSRAHIRAENVVLDATRQPLDAFLVLDVEGTCVEGSSFDYPNEIIASLLFATFNHFFPFELME